MKIQCIIKDIIQSNNKLELHLIKINGDRAIVYHTRNKNIKELDHFRKSGTPVYFDEEDLS